VLPPLAWSLITRRCRLRFGLIGYGAWGKHHAAAIRDAPGLTLAGVACRREASAAAARQDLSGIPVYRDYRELLRDPSIDAVDIVTPNHLHGEIGVAALEAGKDVLLEKPMAVTAAECDRLIAVAERSGRVLSIGHELRVSVQWSAIKAMLDAGEIGEPLYALVTLFRFPYRPGAGGWRYAADRVGSWILEEPVHFFDFVMWYFEPLGDPTSVLAVGNSKGREAGMSDNFSTIIRFPRGVYAVITQTLAGFEHHHVVEIVGTEGAIRTWWSATTARTLEPTHELKVQRRGATACETLKLGPSGELFELAEEIRQTAAAFSERRPLVSGVEARKRVLVCLEAERSLREGRELSLQF
jgi:myo-inositol 2-dehydrogenase / D-chiro-inositol 1-dehydrogenase